MYSLLNDYSEGAHPQVLQALIDTNLNQTVGYGMDEISKEAKGLIKDRVGHNTDVHFVVGGTQANTTVIASILRPYQAVIATDEGHINVHETGAIEATGHKVLTVPHQEGKLTVVGIDRVVKAHTDEHMVQPKMVYISQTTELGSYYTLSELKAIYEYTSSHDLYLYIDGARLGSALALEDAPTFKQMGEYSDVFSIGGTKMGALFGEAIVIVNDDLKKDFRYHIKQRGGMLAKGRLLGVQFKALFEKDLYLEIGQYENRLSMQIKDAILSIGYQLVADSYTNQLFVDMKNTDIQKIEEKFMITKMQPINEDVTRVRFVTSWATKEEKIIELCHVIKNL
ncbi:MAG: aminotransferase class I/II-fold pyridoxal phosphate-dependent enzyme [Bacilli bacterium]|nr:aminotransferase class I/II-fold pyridoxal phosphate-dependent enzyme [Bacilli bacterium]